MKLLWMHETYLDEARNVILGESEPYETAYTASEVGQLYRQLQKEHGACTSRIYVDTKTEQAVPVGWVFRKRIEYEDARPNWSKEQRYYLRSVWCQLYSQRPVRGVSVKNNPFRIDKKKPMYANESEVL